MSTQKILPKIDVSKYKGQWIVVCESKVVANGKDLTKLKNDIKNCKKTPTIARIPSEGILIY